MAGPFGIVQVDAPGLLEMYTQRQRQGLEDRYRQAQFDRQARLDQRAEDEYSRTASAREAIARGAKPEEVIALDPDTGFSYAKHASSMAAAQREAAVTRADAIGNAARFVQSQPPAQQAAAWDQAIDGLVAQGYTDLAEAKGRYDAAALPGYIAASQDAVKAYMEGIQKDRVFSETQRHNRATEGTAAGNLSLARQREQRVTKWGPQPLIGMMPGGIPTDNSDLEY